MNTPPPNRPDRSNVQPPADASDEQVLAWLRLREEMAELHARLEYIKLMLRLGV